MREPTNPETALREFCARILGWERPQAIEHAPTPGGMLVVTAGLHRAAGKL